MAMVDGRWWTLLVLGLAYELLAPVEPSVEFSLEEPTTTTTSSTIVSVLRGYQPMPMMSVVQAAFMTMRCRRTRGTTQQLVEIR